MMAKKADVWRAKGKGDKMGQKSQKAGGNGSGKHEQQNFKTDNKPTWGQKGYGNVVQGKGIVQVIGESSYGYISILTVRY